MHYRVKAVVMFSLIIVTVLSLAGCCSLFPSMPWCPTQKYTPSEREMEARTAIISNRGDAETAVSEIKNKFKGKEAEESYTKAISLYNKAVNANNAWTTLLVLSIQNNENVEKSKSFNSQSEKAAKATDAFLAYKEQLMTGKTINVKMMSFQPIADLVTGLVNSAIIICEEIKKQETTERSARAANVKEALLWKNWDELK